MLMFFLLLLLLLLLNIGCKKKQRSARSDAHFRFHIETHKSTYKYLYSNIGETIVESVELCSISFSHQSIHRHMDPDDA